MDIRVDKTGLMKVLQRVQGIVERKTTMPILANILCEAKPGHIEISATDLEVFIRVGCIAEVLKTGGITIGARKLFEIVKELPDGIIEISDKDGGRIIIKGGKATFTLVGMPVEEFPNFPPHNERQLSPVVSDNIRIMIDRTVFASSTDETRHNLNGVFFEKEGDKIRMVATDGHRLALMEGDGGGGLDMGRGVILPRKGVLELKRLLDEGDGESRSAGIGFTNSTAIFKKGDTILITRLIDGEFPDYRQVIPKDNERVVIIDKAVFLGALRRVSLLSPERIKVVRFNLSKGNLMLSSSNPDLGEAKEGCEVGYSGDELEIGFNARYLMDALEVIKGDGVVLELKDQGSPGILRPADPEGYLYIIMPVRL